MCAEGRGATVRGRGIIVVRVQCRLKKGLGLGIRITRSGRQVERKRKYNKKRKCFFFQMVGATVEIFLF